MAFQFHSRESNGAPTIRTVVAKDTETLTKGDLLNLESGEVDLAATNDEALLGLCLETKAHTDSTTDTEVITDEDAIYSVTDANARKIGAKLDVSGATGAQTVASATNGDLVVVADSTATQKTLVRIHPLRHAFGGTASA